MPLILIVFQTLFKSSGYSESFRVTGRPFVPHTNPTGRPYKPYKPGDEPGESSGSSDPVSATPTGDKLLIIIIVCACAGVMVIIIGCAALVVYMR